LKKFFILAVFIFYFKGGGYGGDSPLPNYGQVKQEGLNIGWVGYNFLNKVFLSFKIFKISKRRLKI